MLQNYTKKGREQNLFSTYSLSLCIFSAQATDKDYHEWVGTAVSCISSFLPQTTNEGCSEQVWTIL